MEHITVIGAGPLGRATTHSLISAGHQVTVATRSGTQLPGAQTARADVVTGDGLDALAPSAAIIACCNFTYTVAGWSHDWPLAIENLIHLAERQDATLVLAGNHYSYARGVMPMHATDPLNPPSTLGEIRADVTRRLFEAHEQGRIRAVEVRGSSYLGVGAGTASYAGDRIITPLLSRGKASIIGSADVPHSWTAVPDFGRLLARAATDPQMLGRAWHVPNAPALSARELARLLFRIAGIDGDPRISVIPTAALRLLGWFSPTMRAIGQTVYQMSGPFISDDTDTRDLLGETHTPLEETLTGIVAEVSQTARTPIGSM